MKKIATLILILTLTFCHGQKFQEVKLQGLKVTEPADSIRLLNKQVQTLIAKQEWKSQILEERLKQASDTISNQNSLFDGFGILYGIITIVIALVAIVLPILTYQFGIKPSQKALKEFENNADKKMENFLAKYRNNQIEQAIENLKSEIPELRSNAISYLTLTQYQGLTNEQLYRLVLALKSGNIDSSIISPIAYLISNRKSDPATDYFKTTINDPENVNIKHAAIRYFANNSIENYQSVFRGLILNSKDQKEEFLSLLSQLYPINQNSFVTLLNDKELIERLDEKCFKELRSSIALLKSATWSQAKKEIEDSYLVEKLATSV